MRFAAPFMPPCALGFLIIVDHEGGRVRAFREGFSRCRLWLPAVRPVIRLRHVWRRRLRAREVNFALRGVDMTFAPVLDIDYGRSAVIGNRSLGLDRHEVERNARALMSGLRLAGMANCGKHFPRSRLG